MFERADRRPHRNLTAQRTKPSLRGLDRTVGYILDRTLDLIALAD
jgi:hypothetical protein